MRFTVTFEQRDPPHAFTSYTIDSGSYTMAMVHAKAECMKFGLRFVRMATAAENTPVWSLYQALEYQTGPERTGRLKAEDYDCLIELALQIKDEGWFTELMNRKRERSRGQ